MDTKEKTLTEHHSFSYYCYPAVITKIISNRKWIFCSWAFLGYLEQFLLLVSALNLYSDSDRHSKCGSALTDPYKDPSSFYDTAFVLLFIFHVIEFIRFTLFMTCAFISVNLM